MHDMAYENEWDKKNRLEKIKKGGQDEMAPYSIAAIHLQHEPGSETTPAGSHNDHLIKYQHPELHLHDIHPDLHKALVNGPKDEHGVSHVKTILHGKVVESGIKDVPGVGVRHHVTIKVHSMGLHPDHEELKTRDNEPDDDTTGDAMDNFVKTINTKKKSDE